MEIIVGKYSGFCNGVKNTVNKTIDELKKQKLYSLGEIVHNEIVIDNLKKMGLRVKESIDDIPNNVRVIIRAHGEPIEIYQKAKEKNLELIDLTCGRVKVIHDKIMNKKDSFVIVVGKKNHPETIAHKSYSTNSYVVEEDSDIYGAYKMFLDSKKQLVYVVAQTTFNSEVFDRIAEALKKVFINVNIEIDKTICNVTSIRQKEVCDIACKVDIMLIVGGKNSSNTKELEIIAKNYCDHVYLIQTRNDLDDSWFSKDDIVGITAGASTPEEVIVDVVNYLQAIYNKKK